MYNGIGLDTARGSGTNGYVQRNLSFVRKHKDRVDYKSEEELKKLDQALQKPPNKEILDHERKRKVELKCMEMQELMEEQGYPAEEIESKVSMFRTMLINKEGVSESTVEKDEFGRPIAKESHQIAEATQQKNARLKEAFGISEHYVDGSSFDPDRKAKEDAAKALAMAQKKYSIVRDSSSSERSVSPPPKRKKKSKSRDDSSSPERRQKKKKSKKHKRDRSQCKKQRSSHKHKRKKSESSHSQKRSKKRRRRRSPSSSSDSRSASPSDSDSSTFDGEKVKPTEKSKKSSLSPSHLSEKIIAKRISRSKSPKVRRRSTSSSSDSSQSPNPRKKQLKTNGHNTASQHKQSNSLSSRSPDQSHKRLSRSLSYSPAEGQKTKESVFSPKLPYKSPSPPNRHSRPSRSRSRSHRHKSSSWSRSRSRSKSSSRSRSRTHSRSRKRRSHSYSKSRSRSRSRSRRRSYSRSPSRSRSRHRMSRSPSIRRRKGSPSHLEKRRITRTQLIDSDRIVQSITRSMLP